MSFGHFACAPGVSNPQITLYNRAHSSTTHKNIYFCYCCCRKALTLFVPNMSGKKKQDKRTVTLTKKQAQGILMRFYAYACEKDKVDLGDMIDEKKEYILIRCPLGQCNSNTYSTGKPSGI